MTAFDLRDALAQSHAHAFAWAVRCCDGDRDQAEEILHVTYAKVLDGSARYGGASTFTTWLFGVIRRTAQEQRRWHALQLRRLERWWMRDGTSAPVTRGAPADDDGRVAALNAALARLSPRQRSMLHLVFFQEMTIQDAANVLAIPVGTARTHYERGKARLRAQLQDVER